MVAEIRIHLCKEVNFNQDKAIFIHHKCQFMSGIQHTDIQKGTHNLNVL